MVIRLCLIAFIGLVFSLFVQEANAQHIVRHQSPVAFERGETKAIQFDVTSLDQSDIIQASLFYRYDGDFSYQQRAIDYRNGSFTLQFDIDDYSASRIEYYLEVELTSGQTLTYPESEPSENPVQVEIVDTAEQALPELEGIEHTVLSPRPGKGMRPDNVVIALALFYDETTLPEGEFRLLLGDTDVTHEADTSDFYISYLPETLPPGSHTVRLLYNTPEQTYSVTEWDFFVVRVGQPTFRDAEPANNVPAGRVELGARNQVIAGDVNNAYTGRTRISGSYRELDYSINGYLTSQESDRLQPQNRYGLRLAMGEWWTFEAGHVYPTMSKFTISGRRVHGLNTSFHLPSDKLNVQFIYGEVNRKITNLYDGLEISEVTTPSGVVVDTSYTITYQEQGRGTFQRKIIGGRIGVGKPEGIQFGVHALKIKDDTTSLVNIRDYFSLVRTDNELSAELSEADRNKLSQNPNLLQVQGGAVRPRDNFVAGSDLKLGFHDNRIRMESEVAISALNDNIYGGPIDVERADELGFDLSQSDANLLDRLSWLVIINENMNTLPLRIKEDESGDDKATLFFPTSILAGSSELSARYFDNNFRMQYRWIGPNFNSLANSTVRKDVAGFTISDRINLLQNRIYLTLGFESLKDNVVGNRDATTRTNTYRTNVSWYPQSRTMPRVTAGLRYRNRDNGIERNNFEVISQDLVTATLRNQQINADGDTVVTSFPRTNNTINFNTSVSQEFRLFDLPHDASLNFTTLKTTDETFAFGDVKSTAVSANLTSRFEAIALQTELGTTYNYTNSGSGQNKMSIFGMFAGGEFVTLQGKLRLNARVAFTQNQRSSRTLEVRDKTSSGSLDDNPGNDYYVLSEKERDETFATFVLQSGTRYNFNDYHAVVFETNITNVNNVEIPTDRIIQFRYIFNF